MDLISQSLSHESEKLFLLVVSGPPQRNCHVRARVSIRVDGLGAPVLCPRRSRQAMRATRPPCWLQSEHAGEDNGDSDL